MHHSTIDLQNEVHSMGWRLGGTVRVIYFAGCTCFPLGFNYSALIIQQG
jgi:hypothetical protein